MSRTFRIRAASFLSLVAALMLAAGPNYAMIEQVPTIDPLHTPCAAFVKQSRESSAGHLVFVVNLLPVTGNSPFGDQAPEGTNLYGDQAGLGFIPIDPKSYATIVKRKAPVWLFLSFEGHATEPVTLRRSIAFAASDTCHAGETQYTAVDSVPIEIKRKLLSALIDLRHGGRGDPLALPVDEIIWISRLFPASVDAEIQQALQILGSTQPEK